MSRRTRRLLGALTYVAYLVVFVELALQTFYYATSGGFLFARTGLPIFAPNEWSGVFNKANLAYHHHTNEFDATNHTNSQGLRVPEGAGDYALDPPPDTTRILLLGPSFAYGWGVDYEATFGHLLEQRLEEAGWGGASRVQLINAGVPSLGMAPHLDWYRHVGRSFRPDLIVQFAYGSMAVRNDREPRYEVTDDGYLVVPDRSATERAREQAKKSAIVFYAWILKSRLDAALTADASDPDEPREILGAGREMHNARTFDLERPVVQESLAFYRDLRETARDTGAEVLIVYFPLSYAIHEEDVSRWRHLGVVDVEAQRRFDAAMCDHLDVQEDIPCLDITPALRRAAAEGDERLYYWLDVHWTEAGNRVAADAVADHLVGSR